MAKTQAFKHKKGEVLFRRRLIEYFKGIGPPPGPVPTLTQQLKDNQILLKQTRKVFQLLEKNKILKTPFLDLGSAFCLRSLLLIKKFGLNGFALDISFDALNYSPALAKQLGFKKLPQRICADLYHLPFPDDCLPFIFTFQTLHHLPSPQPALREIHRVLAPGGYFYFGEEPIRQSLNFRLWRRGYQLNLGEKLLKAAFLLPFLSEIGAAEQKFGALENTFSLTTWQKALKVFDSVEATLTPFKIGPKDKISQSSPKSQKTSRLKPKLITRFFLALVGGGISAICQKQGKLSSQAKIFLACPLCHTQLKTKRSKLSCPRCQEDYKIKKKIAFLLPKNLERKLYPPRHDQP